MRVVGHFSCGAASAVACKLALAEYGRESVVIYNAFIWRADVGLIGAREVSAMRARGRGAVGGAEIDAVR